MSNVTMKSKDTISAKLAECYITIGDRRYNFMSMTKAEFKFEKQKTEVAILGKTGKGNKSTGNESDSAGHTKSGTGNKTVSGWVHVSK